MPPIVALLCLPLSSQCSLAHVCFNFCLRCHISRLFCQPFPISLGFHELSGPHHLLCVPFLGGMHAGSALSQAKCSGLPPASQNGEKGGFTDGHRKGSPSWGSFWECQPGDLGTTGPKGLEKTDITSSTNGKVLGKLPESTLPPANSIRVKTQRSLVSGTLGTGSKQPLPDCWVSASLLQSQAERYP